MYLQRTFSVREAFRWVQQGDGSWWYEIDLREAEKAALKARNQEAKRLREKGHTVSKFSMGPQLLSFGGIGSGKPHIEIVARCYGLDILS